LITWDQGIEVSYHADLGTDLPVHSAADLARIAASLNDRPRKTLGFMKPSEKLAELLAHTG
jgi:transposase, IS30 family